MFLQIPLSVSHSIDIWTVSIKNIEICTLFQPIKTVIIKELTGSQWKLYENQPKSEDLWDFNLHFTYSIYMK